MIALVLHEARVLTRRAVWPVALALHATAAAAFVVIWGPTGGVPLWDASVLRQLSALERVVSAVLLTWLATYVLAADDEERRLGDWSAVTGRTVKAVFGARLALTTIVAAVFVSVSAPAFAAAGESAAATPADVAVQIGMAWGFAMLCVGLTASASVALGDRVAVWCTAMAISLIAAVGVQLLHTTWLRAGAPAAAGIVLMTLAAAGVRARRDDRAF